MDRSYLFAAVAMLAACGPKDLPRDEIHGVLFPEKGEFAGYDIGDSWSDIKAKHPDFFAVRDDEHKQLRRDVGDNAGSNGYYLGFAVKDDKVTEISASVSGKKQNVVAIRQLFDEVIERYDKALGKGKCMSSSPKDTSTRCEWAVQGKTVVKVHYFDMPDLHSAKLDVAVLSKRS